MIRKASIESERLALQQLLDSQKGPLERNRLGQFATPTGLAVDMLVAARRFLVSGEKIRFLDPAIGTGSFYSALLTVFPENSIQWAKGFEIDAHYGGPSRNLWTGHGLEVTVADFTRQTPPGHDMDKANLIVCNPPYVRHHHLTASEKSRLQRATLRSCGAALNGLTGLYCHFLGLSHAWLARGGIGLWLVPTEFLDVNYGARVKEYLLHAVTLERIHCFDPSDVQFGDAIVSSAVICFRNAPRPPGHVVEFSRGGTLATPGVHRELPADDLEPADKWTGLASPDSRASLTSATRLGDLFTIRRGIATGANNYFVFSPEKAETLGLPKELLRPLLPSPRYLDVDEIESDPDGSPLIQRPLVLLDCNLPEEDVRREFPRVWAYYQKGAASGISQRYLCRHRQPWYSQEYRPPAPFLCTYMGRCRQDKTVFRFILNHSNATAANVYLLLYPKPALRNAICGNAAKMREVWNALRRIDPETLIGAGRVYGGGLHKMEPRELAAAPADAIIELVPEAEPSRATLFAE